MLEAQLCEGCKAAAFLLKQHPKLCCHLRDLTPGMMIRYRGYSFGAFPEGGGICDKSDKALRVRGFVGRADRTGPRVRAQLDGSGADGCRRQDVSRFRQ